MFDPLLIGSIIFGVAVFAMFMGALRILASRSVTLDERLGADFGADESLETARAGTKGQSRRFNRLVSGTARERILSELMRADLKFTPGEYVMGQIVMTLLGFMVGFVIFRGNLLTAVAGGLIGLYLPRWYVKHLQRKRLNAFDAQLPDAILLIANALRSGYSLMQSLDTVSKEVGSPMSQEFVRVTRELNLGLSTDEAFDNLALRIPSDDLSMVITAIDIQNQVGGNLAEILDIIAHTIRERVRIMGEIRTITAQQRLAARVLALLPLGIAAILYALNPQYISQLWQSQCGLVMIGIGTVMSITGYLFIRRIAMIRV